MQSGVQGSIYPAFQAITGRSTEITQSVFNDSVKALKEHLRSIDAALSGDYLVGNQVTVADVMLASAFGPCF